MEFDIIFLIEIVGTIAFAVSGASVAIEHEMDLFGVVTLGMTTAVGGGIIRDFILGVTPPMAFQNPFYALLAIAVSLLVFVQVVRKVLSRDHMILFAMDTLGLGVFTVIGVRAGMVYDNFFLCVFVGALTGIGGGVLRDLFAGIKPKVFVKHFYACASIIGAAAATLLWPLGEITAMIIGAAIVIVLRVLASKYKWNLPKAL